MNSVDTLSGPDSRDTFNTASIKIDTLSGIRPIKNIEYSPYTDILEIFYRFLILALLVGIYFLYKFLFKKFLKSPSLISPKLDPYVWAENQIQSLKNKEILNRAPYKEYFNQISEIIREFIWKVNQIDAPHKTSTQALEELMLHPNLDENKKIIIRQILEKVDKVKFSGEPSNASSVDEITLLALKFVSKPKTS